MATITLDLPSVVDPDVSSPGALECCCPLDLCDSWAAVNLYFFTISGTPDVDYFGLLCSGADLDNAPASIHAVVFIDGTQNKLEMSISTPGDLTDYGTWIPFGGTLIPENQVDGEEWFYVATRSTDDIYLWPNGLAKQEYGDSVEGIQLVCLDNYY